MRLTRSDHHDLEPTVRVRPPRSGDPGQMKQLLPWFTPLLVYRLDGEDWIRWHVPFMVAVDIGISGGCTCCGGGALEVEGGFHVDTTLGDTDWFLKDNGYEVPAFGVANRNADTPQKEGKEQ